MLRVRSDGQNGGVGDLDILAVLFAGFGLLCLFFAWHLGVEFFRHGMPARLTVGDREIHFGRIALAVYKSMFVCWFVSLGLANFVGARWLIRRDKLVLIATIAFANALLIRPIGLVLAVVTVALLLSRSHRSQFKRAY